MVKAIIEQNSLSEKIHKPNKPGAHSQKVKKEDSPRHCAWPLPLKDATAKTAALAR